MKDYLLLTRLVCLTEVDTNEVEDTDDFFTAMDELEEELEPLLKKYGLTYTFWESTSFSRKKYAIERCEACSHWLVNRSKNLAGLDKDSGQYWQIEMVIRDGAEYKGLKVINASIYY